MSQNNPLRQYFRQPAIYIKLPSNGEFYPPGTLDMPPNRELPVLPMTAVDEMTYRTPDALFNGSAVVNVIQSCVPNILNAWAIPAMDIDSILIAIRIASYGHDMEFTSQCPKCNEVADRTLDLRTVLDRMRTPDYKSTIAAGDIEIYFRPMNYKSLNDNNQLQFEEQKILQMLPDTEVPNADKITALNSALKKLTDLTIRALAQSIASIKTPTAFVNESEYIEEFLQNCERTLFNRIRDHAIDIKGQSEMQPLSMTCDACQTEYQQILTMDMSSFFEPAS